MNDRERPCDIKRQLKSSTSVLRRSIEPTGQSAIFDLNYCRDCDASVNVTLWDSRTLLNYFDWAKNFINKHSPVAKVLFSPCWERMEIEKLADWIVSEKLPVRLGIQQHKVIWGTETRGV